MDALLVGSDDTASAVFLSDPYLQLFYRTRKKFSLDFFSFHFLTHFFPSDQMPIREAYALLISSDDAAAVASDADQQTFS
jgi:hypothetical protein